MAKRRHSLMLVLLNGGWIDQTGVTSSNPRHSLMLVLLNGGSGNARYHPLTACATR